MAIGQVLTAPETGWQRYNDTNSKINYFSGNWARNFTYDHISTGDSKVRIKFYGTKFRYLTYNYTNRCSVKITVDGVDKGIYLCNIGVSPNTLTYEILDLPLGQHTILIERASAEVNMSLDAIDIDDNGHLIHPTLNQVSDINNMKIGDCIPCRYTAIASGVAGYFSELGTCIADEIPVTGTPTPDGLFYLIKTDKGTLIADRIIQTNISWDVLNTAKYIEGISLGISHSSYNSETAIYMNGIDEVLKKINPSIPSLSNFTIEVLWNINSVANASAHYPSVASLESETTSANNTVNMYIDPQAGGSGALVCWNDGSISDLRKTAVLPVGLNHFALTYDGSILNEYRNGILYNNASALNKIINLSTNTLLLGKGIGFPGGVASSAYIKGILYHFRVWDKSLSLSQINDNKYRCLINDSSIVYSVNENDYNISILQTKFPNMVGIDSSNIIIADKYKSFKSLSGGCAYADDNGNSSLTDKSLGAWPVNNEYDKYIVNSDLGGKITKGDNNIWHFSSLYTFCKDVPVISLTPNTSRTYRGKTTNLNFGYSTSSSSATDRGFRPVLNYIESDIQSEVIY